MIRFISLLCAAIAMIVFLKPTAVADDLDATNVNGLWMSHTGGLVAFGPCGETVCGVLEWDPVWDETGSIPLDDKNPEAALRARSIKGIPILFGFRETRRGWRSGTFYSPWEGKSYPANVRRVDDETLRVQGCIARILCRSFDWKRADAAVLETSRTLKVQHPRALP
ncbi:MAG: DUF2147 domain-containing protein [Pseudomonadota bacterium]